MPARIKPHIRVAREPQGVQPMSLPSISRQVHGSLRLVILVTFAVAFAVSSFANSFAVMLGVAAIGVAGGFAVIILVGAVVSLGRNRVDDEALPASVRLSNEDIG